MVHTQQLYFWQHFRANRLKGNPADGDITPAIQPAVEMEAQSGGRLPGGE